MDAYNVEKDWIIYILWQRWTIHQSLSLRKKNNYEKNDEKLKEQA